MGSREGGSVYGSSLKAQGFGTRVALVPGMAKNAASEASGGALAARRKVAILNRQSGVGKPMGRTLSLLARLPRLEEDGVTHRRDCECVRCDAGFRPTERERAAARRRVGEQRAREQAARDMARREERERMKQAVVDVFVDGQIKAANDQVRALREARERAAADENLARLWELRRAGFSLRDALDEVERAAGEAPRKEVGPAGFEPAAYGLKVRSSAS
jgi:hypothetical protein